ncbi:MAG: UDP-forming cellulose synthase catalytic subunit [Chitinispirillaceae bacterium]|nr:UDP-forming cellulose synthase catalytic subunit [Chitinispirillaceae bacterium]
MSTAKLLSASAIPFAGGIARAVRLLATVVAVVMLTLVMLTPLELREQVTLSGMLFVVALVIAHLRHRASTLILMVMAITVSARYLAWRISATMSIESLDLLLSAALLFAELYAFLVLALGYFQLSQPIARKPLALPADVREWPAVDVLIPTYNEPLEVVRATILAAQALDWPQDKLRIFVLDDGNRDDFQHFAKDVGVGYFIRHDNHGAKAGNINAALARTDAPFVAVFDCDHVPTRSFLQLTMGWLVEDDRLAMVQTPHHFYSPDPLERNLRVFKTCPNEGELFYGLIQPGNDLWNAVFFCGSCAVIRRAALTDVGGISEETVTEDAHTALRMHRCGWRTAFLGVRQAGGLATESLSGHIRQRVRWARGMVQILRVDNPLFGPGLTWPQRLCYLNGQLYFLSGLPRLIFLTAPLGFFLFNAHIFAAAPVMVLSYALPHLTFTLMTASRIQGGFRRSFWGELYETVLSVYIVLPTILALVNPRLGRFNVTAKGGLIATSYFDWRIAMPFLVLFGLNLAGIVAGLWAASTGRQQLDAVLINVGWATYNLIILSTAIAAAFERQQRRRHARIAPRLPAMVERSCGHTVACELSDLSLSGAALNHAGDEFERGEKLHLTLRLGEESLPLPARVVSTEAGVLRLEFVTLSPERERFLVRVLFCRADSWIRWADDRTLDQPVRSFLDISLCGLRGLKQLVISSTTTRGTHDGKNDCP